MLQMRRTTPQIRLSYKLDMELTSFEVDEHHHYSMKTILVKAHTDVLHHQIVLQFKNFTYQNINPLLTSFSSPESTSCLLLPTRLRKYRLSIALACIGSVPKCLNSFWLIGQHSSIVKCSGFLADLAEGGVSGSERRFVLLGVRGGGGGGLKLWISSSLG